MFEDNWFLFLLIVMIAFAGDGNFSNREIAVMFAILGALALTNQSIAEDVNTNCFCNRNV